jgi:RNA-directed DNA polymerase
MRKFTIAKRGGGARAIYAPNHKEKLLLRLLVPRLNRLQQQLCAPCVHGFMPERSPVTNAQAHAGKQFTLCMDLADFFDSVDPEDVPALKNCGLFTPEEIARMAVDGAARQGLPTSPIVANLAAIPMDTALLQLSADHGAVYTRYADDLSFSCDSIVAAVTLRAEIVAIVADYGFKVNPRKTRLLSSQSGRRIVTGVAVGAEVKAPRAIRRRLRAAYHQRHIRQAAGLTEWSKMRMPAVGKIRATKALTACARWNAIAWFERRGKQTPVSM